MTTSALRFDVVVPVFNEEDVLERSVRELHATLSEGFGDRWCITIADNASTDATSAIAARLSAELEEVRVLRVPEAGRGRALKAAWLASEAEVVAYVDVDLSTDLRALAPLLAPLLTGHSDVAIGTRLRRDSRVVRGLRREVISRAYNTVLQVAMGVRFSDAQCGFKAMRRDVAQRILPLVADTGWFFDTELLIIAERSGLRIHEVPVDWIDDPRSSVDVVATATADLRGLVRVARALTSRAIPIEALYAELGRQPFLDARPSFAWQATRFLAVGGFSTIAFAVLYLLLQQVIAAQVANFVALLVTAVANTWANRRFTFGVRGSRGAGRHQLQGLAVFAVAWAITSGSLAVLHLAVPTASAHVELVVLTAANLIATAVRFVLLRHWVFRTRAVPAPTSTRRPFVTSREKLVDA